MNSSPAVTVVMPVWNVRPWVAEAIESALTQTFRDFELIVVNDGSTDGTGEYLDTLSDPRLRVVHQANAGSAAARNVGIALARGHYIAFLDGDDRWMPEKLERHVRCLDSRPSVDLSFSLSTLIFADGQQIGLQREAPEGTLSFAGLLLDNKIANGSAVVMRTSTIKEAGGFRAELRACVDLDCWLRVARLRENNVWCLAEALTVYRHRPGQITADWRRMRDARKNVMENLGIIGDPQYPGIPGEAESNAHRWYAWIAYGQNEFREAVKLAARSFRLAPWKFLQRADAWLVVSAAVAGMLLGKDGFTRLRGLARRVRSLCAR